MGLNELVPWKWGKRNVPVRTAQDEPYRGLQQEMNRVFDSFFSSFMRDPLWSPQGLLSDIHELPGSYAPNIDVAETDREIRVTAELPGMDIKDIDVSIANDMLTISGEKKQNSEQSVKGYHRVERIYSSFRRSIGLPCQVDANKVEAVSTNGVLTIVLPKMQDPQRSIKSIPVRHG